MWHADDVATLIWAPHTHAHTHKSWMQQSIGKLAEIVLIEANKSSSWIHAIFKEFFTLSNDIKFSYLSHKLFTKIYVIEPITISVYYISVTIRILFYYPFSFLATWAQRRTEYRKIFRYTCVYIGLLLDLSIQKACSCTNTYTETISIDTFSMISLSKSYSV